MELAPSLGQMTLTSPPAPAPPAKPFRFMDLPTELRIAVYEEVVVVGNIFYAVDESETRESIRYKHHELYRVPDLRILRVSKKVHEEVEQVYLTKYVDYMTSPRFLLSTGANGASETFSFSLLYGHDMIQSPGDLNRSPNTSSDLCSPSPLRRQSDISASRFLVPHKRHLPWSTQCGA